MKKPLVTAVLVALVPLAFFAASCGSSSNSPAGQAGPAGGTPGQGGGAGAAGADPTLGGSGGEGFGAQPGTGGGAGVGGAASSSGDLLVDDFEDGDKTPLIPGGWYTFNDGNEGGKSTLTFKGATGSDIAMNGEGYQSKRALEVSFSLDQGTYKWAPYVAVGVGFGGASTPLDLSSYAGISYTYRGAAHTVRIETSEVTDYDVYASSVSASADWTTVVLPYKSFNQGGWGQKVSFVPAHTTAISFMIPGATADKGTLDLDNLKALKTISQSVPDMVIQPASPPADSPIASVVISNPLQAKAMQYLTKGYNITNWLEQGDFTTFLYDEAFVQKLSLAGYKAIRLPIDLDRYVDSKTGTGPSLAITVNPNLFTVLDSFDTWTKKYGLSLTIDYHQYGTLLDKSNPDTIATATLLWSNVAEHFAANPREDLFFELLNEPELSFVSSGPPTQAEWTTIAQGFITAIRAKDPSHTIIFGDTNWYGIAQLASRKPFADTNIVYAFHNYDPFIFTHQGASWANMPATHDIPYPYDPTRWSQYYSDLGFAPTAASWILSAAKGYYQTGNKSAIRNGIVVAKQWAVTNNVPVICNEFGAYDGTSRLEDRARYYKDFADIMTELQIPWQNWFMLMDKNTGVVAPEYKAALGL